ncbi:MAG TPA: hypothetical protein DCK95_07310 [Anaerolineaceae bacterium]|nr:hypothetical protein [Anaerolineaceae bacterium]
MKNNVSFSWLFLPILILALVSAAIFIERAGISPTIREPSLNFLKPKEDETNGELIEGEPKSLVLYDSVDDDGLRQLTVVTDTLDSMRVRYDIFDINEAYDVNDFIGNGYEVIVITFYNLDKLNQQILDLTQWVENGGRMLFSIRPEITSTFTAIYRKLGIISYGYDFTSIAEILYTSDLFPGMKMRTLESGFVEDTSLALQLEDEAHVHLSSADRNATPILWDYDLGDGRFVVINSDQFLDKYDRGVICAAYSLLYDTFIYPVINSSMVFIDDFPGPIPEGSNEIVYQEFGKDIEEFYINIWWPDMKDFARRYGLEYTGLLIETYNEKVAPPFIEEKSVERYEYFGDSLLDLGGELGLHGYNHVPLVTNIDEIPAELGYPVWSSTEAMQTSIQDLYTFGISLFPEQEFFTYVPPSNILSSEARAWIPEIIPEVRVIAAQYIEYPAIAAFYDQEFEEASDGIIEVPRVISGYAVSPFYQWTAANELVLHYVNSHFVHPDDVLDEERSKGQGWVYLRDQFEQYLIWLESAAPGIRNMTASEGGMAVQRFDRLGVSTDCDNAGCIISLSNFYDEAWLLMRTKLAPATIRGGTITEVTPSLYLIGAQDARVEIDFEE